MNAETRAKALMVAVSPNSHWTDDQHDLIARAIREAENDKLEEAALAAEMLTLVHPIAGGIAQNIRSLKSKD